VPSAVMVANGYLHGFPVKKSIRKALSWYKFAACHHSSAGIYGSAYVYYKKNKYIKAYAWMLLFRKDDSKRASELMTLTREKLSNVQTLDAEDAAERLCSDVRPL